MPTRVYESTTITNDETNPIPNETTVNPEMNTEIDITSSNEETHEGVNYLFSSSPTNKQQLIHQGVTPTPSKKNTTSDSANKSHTNSQPQTTSRSSSLLSKSIDNQSTSSDTTKKNKNHDSYHYNDSDGENSWDSDEDEKEDDVNTVSSDKTSQIKKKEGNKVILPSFTRYQFMVQLDQDTNETPILDNDAEEKSPVDRMREFLIKMTNQIKSYDKDAKIISWKTSDNFTYMNMDDFPSDVAEMALYFNGLRRNIKTDKRVYLRVGIHTPNSQSRMYSLMDSWMRLYGYSFSKCIIQAESSTCIGWLVYSSQYTNSEPIRRRLMEISQFEWGFKLVAIQESDSKDPWLTRARAVGVYVPTNVKDIAIAIVGEQFEPATEDLDIQMPDITDKYLFMEPERTYKGSESRKLYYKQMVERQILHCESSVAEIAYGIKVDLDQEFEFGQHKLSLRDIVLDLRVETTDNRLYGTRLFCSIDFFEDSSNLWINGEKCAGGSCCVFTYYEACTSEATTMIKGMGRMIAKEYDLQFAGKMFTLNHFRASKGYKWHTGARRFSTPQVRRMKLNKDHDYNLSALSVLRALKEEKQKVEEEEKAKESENETNQVDNRRKNTKEEKLDKAMTDTENSSSTKKQHNSSTLSQINNIEPTDGSLSNRASSPTKTQQIPPTIPEEEETSEASDLTKELKEEQLVQLARKQIDNDFDSLEDNSVKKKQPNNISINDDNSVASSLTYGSLPSETGSLTNASLVSGTNSTSNVSLTSGNNSTKASSARSKYELTTSIVQTIAEEGVKEGLNIQQIEQKVLAYQRLKINEATTKAIAAVANFAKKNNIPLNNEVNNDSNIESSTPSNNTTSPSNHSSPPDKPQNTNTLQPKKNQQTSPPQSISNENEDTKTKHQTDDPTSSSKETLPPSTSDPNDPQDALSNSKNFETPKKQKIKKPSNIQKSSRVLRSSTRSNKLPQQTASPASSEITGKVK